MDDRMAKITAELQERFPDVGIKSVEVDESSGKSTFYIEPTKKSLAFLENPNIRGTVIPKQFRDKGAVVTRDAINRNRLDLGLQKDPYDEDAQTNFERAIRYYYTDPLVGSATNLLSNLAFKGFENDIDDTNIKQFYDAWVFDVNFGEILESIFLDFFKVGHVTTYKVLAKYEPRVSPIAPIPGQKKSKTTQKVAGRVNGNITFERIERMRQLEFERYVANAKERIRSNGGKITKNKLKEIENAAKKSIWSKGHLPVAYTVLNPLAVNIEGNLLFNNVSVKLTPPNELRDLLQKPSSDQTEEERRLIKALPSDLKRAAESGEEYQLDSRLVGQITYRKQPYERYAKPRSTRVFDSIEYKKALREADLSTLDGITNYILKITIGNDEYPVVSQEELEAVAQLFNTPSKSFDVVWNHTLEVEKIVSPEISEVLGKEKYGQVNDDMTIGLAITRSIIDGAGSSNAAEINLLTKGLVEEINYARRQVTRWIYREYQQIAEAVGFDRIPKVRWDESILKDIIMYMNTLAQLVDRRMLSYRTALEQLRFDFPNELENMKEEFDLVQDGIFGILGSPWQQAKSGVQPTGAPVGTPSTGRPKGQPAKTKEPETNPQKKVTKTTKTPKSAKSSEEFKEVIKSMSEEEYAAFKHELDKTRFNE
jgi:hypothetical protein